MSPKYTYKGPSGVPTRPDYKALLDDMRDICRKKNEEIVELRARVEELEQSLAANTKEHVDTQIAYEQLRAENTNLHGANRNWQTLSLGFERERDELRTEIERMKARVGELERVADAVRLQRQPEDQGIFKSMQYEEQITKALEELDKDK